MTEKPTRDRRGRLDPDAAEEPKPAGARSSAARLPLDEERHALAMELFEAGIAMDWTTAVELATNPKNQRKE